MSGISQSEWLAARRRQQAAEEFAAFFAGIDAMHEELLARSREARERRSSGVSSGHDKGA